MSFDPVAALVAYHAALDGHDVEKLRVSFVEDATYDSPGLGVLTGKAAILNSVESYFATMPDHKAWDDKVWKVSDLVAACEWHLRATNKATGQMILRRGTETITFNAGGLIVSVVVRDLPSLPG